MTRQSGSPERLLTLLAGLGALASTPVIFYDIALDGISESPRLISLTAPLFLLAMVLVVGWRRLPLSLLASLSFAYALLFIPIVALSTFTEPPHASSAFPWPWYLQPAAVAFVAIRSPLWVTVCYLVLSSATPLVVTVALGRVAVEGLLGASTRRIGLVVIVAIVYAVRHQLQDYAEELSRNDERELKVVRQREGRIAEERYRVAVHDHVLGTLISIVHSEGHATAAVQAQARSALRLRGIEHNPRMVPIREWSRDLLAHIELVADGRLCESQSGVTDDAEGPGDALAAIADAAVEAARNAVRHNPPHTRINIRIDAHADRVQVTLTDDGVGFDAEAPRDRLGVSESILNRMASVTGGSVHLDSIVGEGTTVRLGWVRT